MERQNTLQANSRKVSSNQPHLHPKLPAVLRRHLASEHEFVISAHNTQAYKTLTSTLAANPRPLVLDSFCGTGHSTAELAERHPQHLIVGIDKSAARLSKHAGSTCDNYLLLQGDCEAVWKLLADDGHCIDYHYLLYPNPWPKAAHLQRRIHGHPSFPLLARLGGQLELRSNWQTYVEEFGLAMHLSGHRGSVRKMPSQQEPLTLFEQKYQHSGHDLWSFTTMIMP
jgi:tRNA (guanine-N7-)-methyltransferase